MFHLCLPPFIIEQDMLHKVVLLNIKLKVGGETMVDYLTTEKPTSKVKFLAFKTLSFVISYCCFFFNVEKS